MLRSSREIPSPSSSPPPKNDDLSEGSAGVSFRAPPVNTEDEDRGDRGEDGSPDGGVLVSGRDHHVAAELGARGVRDLYGRDGMWVEKGGVGDGKKWLKGRQRSWQRSWCVAE